MIKSNLALFLAAQCALLALGLYVLWLASNDALYWLLVVPVPFKVMVELGRARKWHVIQRRQTAHVVSVLEINS